jgi:hypothetical protein
MFILITYQELLTRELICHIMSYDHSLGPKEFLDQFNLFYIWICLYFATYELWTRKLIDRVMGCVHSLGRKKILKFIYCFMILFLIMYILNFFIISII